MCFFCEVELFFNKSPVGFDHVGEESEDDELETDDEENSGEEKVVPVGGNFEILNIKAEEYTKEEKRDTHEGESRDAEEFHRTNVSDRFYDNARTLSDIVHDALCHLGFPLGKIGDGHRDPYDFESFADSVDDDFLRVGEVFEEIETEK